MHDPVRLADPAHSFLLIAAIGFLAQIVDGAIGMAYKVTASSLLLGLGLPPATVSGTVHAAGAFTSAVSGFAHWRLGNLDKSLLLRLAVPGIVGGVLGSLVLVAVPADAIRPWISLYLLLLGLYILSKAILGGVRQQRIAGRVAPLGLVGGLFDAIGGGGWGPIVTTTLVGHGVPPRIAIGSVNTAEFFVTVTIAGTLLVATNAAIWVAVAALVAGGVVAAPFAALATRHLPERVLMATVGIVVMVLCVRALALSA